MHVSFGDEKDIRRAQQRVDAWAGTEAVPIEPRISRLKPLVNGW